MMVNILNVKRNFTKRYPESTLSKILATEPDEMEANQFLAKISTWIKILDIQENIKGGG